MPILESNIFITGNLEDLSCTQKDISEWVQALIDVEEGLDELITAKNINFSFVSEEEIQKLNFGIKNVSISEFSMSTEGFTLKAFNSSLIPEELETFI